MRAGNCLHPTTLSPPQVRPHGEAVTALAATADAGLLFSGSADGSIFVLRRAEVVHALRAQEREKAAVEAMEGVHEPAEGQRNANSSADLTRLREADARYATHVVCTRLDKLEAIQRELQASRTAHGLLSDSFATETTKLEVRHRVAHSEGFQKQAMALQRAERRAHQLALQHNLHMGTVHEKLMQFADQVELKRKEAQRKLENTILAELATCDKLKTQLKEEKEGDALEQKRLNDLLEGPDANRTQWHVLDVMRPR